MGSTPKQGRQRASALGAEANVLPDGSEHASVHDSAILPAYGPYA
jgi:hypothetical protein